LQIRLGMKLNLDDLTHFLAVARTSSTLAASKMLGVNQTTCARRIGALEKAMGLTLFDREPTGYRLTSVGTALVAHAERVEAASALLQQAARELMRAERAEIRFSTSDVLADLIAGPALASFARENPDIRVALHVDSGTVDLGQNEADVALQARTSAWWPGRSWKRPGRSTARRYGPRNAGRRRRWTMRPAFRSRRSTADPPKCFAAPCPARISDTSATA
jgi:DNA-binding transcriptional LysR family regulator